MTSVDKQIKFDEKTFDPDKVDTTGQVPLTHADGGEQRGLTQGAWRHGD